MLRAEEEEEDVMAKEKVEAVELKLKSRLERVVKVSSTSEIICEEI